LGAIDTGTYHDILRPANRNARAMFTEITGITLPKGQRATEALFTGQPFQPKGTPAAVPTPPSEIRKGEVGGMMSSGEVVLTSSGRKTTPFPEIRFESERKALSTIKRVDRWLMENALAEAESRGDRFNANQFRANLEKPQNPDKDSAEEYLFGQQPAVIPSILKPFVAPAPAPAPAPDLGTASSPTGNATATEGVVAPSTAEPAVAPEPEKERNEDTGNAGRPPGQPMADGPGVVSGTPTTGVAGTPPAGEVGPDAGQPAPADAGTVRPPSEAGVPGGGGVPDRVGEAVAPDGGTTGPAAGEPAIANPKGPNFVLPTDRDWIPKGAKTRVRANLTAIRTLKVLESENRQATESEKEALANYTGWGAFPQVFDTGKQNQWERDQRNGYAYDTSTTNWRKQWGELYDQVKAELTEDEWRSARQSTINAHYTSRVIINGLWSIAERLGFTGGRALEPALGVGHIIGLTPESVRDRTSWSASELDDLSARISAKLYPSAEIQAVGFERTRFSKASFDLVISNVPFERAGPSDSRYPDLSLHNYFFARAIDLTKPGGLVVFITSESTMDSPSSDEARAYFAKHADLVGAIRLPNTAFSENAGTEVTTDILVFRRKDGARFYGHEFQRIVPAKTHDGRDTTVNQYFDANPGQLLGQLSLDGTLYGGGDQRTLIPIPGADLEQQLKAAIATFPENVMGAAKVVAPQIESELASGKLGQLAVRDGVVKQNIEGRWEDPDWAKDREKVAEAKSYIRVRDSFLELVTIQTSEQATDEQVEQKRAELNSAYDAHVSNYAALNSKQSAWLEDDVDFYSTLSLEDPSTATTMVGKKVQRTTEWKKAPIFSRRTIFPRSEPTNAANAKDAVSVSINFRGRIDLPFIASLLGVSEESAQSSILSDRAAYLDPATGVLEQPSKYLSGSVKEKLRRAEAAAEEDPRFAPNVEALKAIQPERIPINRIGVRLGAHWVPEGAVDDFNAEVLGVKTKTTLVRETGRWFLTIESGGRSADNTVKWGIHGYTGTGLVLDSLNLKNAEVTMTVTKISEATGKPYEAEVKDVPKTLEAQEKQRILKDAFTKWVKESPTWAAQVEENYNEVSNGHTFPRFEGATWEHFPGASSDIILRSHQKEVVSRILQQSTLLAHAVGTGKTYVMTTAAMEMRRIGLAKKPMIVVQNATLEQFARAFRRLYPSARVLAPNSTMREEKMRNVTMSRIATGDWDCVIVPQSWIDMMPNDSAREERYIKDRIEGLERARLSAERTDGSKSHKTKDIAKAIKKLRKDLDELLTLKKDTGMTFEQIGVDSLFVDEAHAYKKNAFDTKKDNIKGLDKGASKIGLSMFLKVRWVQEKNQGRNVVFATGTPVSNTLAEAWNMLRFVRPDILEEFKVSEFDQFDTTYGESVVQWEMGAGGDYKQVERYAKFVNVQSLIRMFRQAADVVTAEEINLPGIPAIKGGSRRSVAIDRTEDLSNFIGVLQDRLLAFERMTGRQKRENSHIPMVAFGEAKKATLDMRLIDARLRDDPGSKLNTAVTEILRIYRETREVSGAQMVFSDSINDPTKTFNAHREIRRKLIEGGIPEDKVVVVDSKIKDELREILFDRVRNGDVAVLIGSTQRMGVGVDVPQHLVALHHLDAPHRPMDVEQREGRILRQGNQNPVVEILVYGVKKTLDSPLFQRLLTKQAFINQILKGSINGDSIDDASNEATMSYSEQMASFSGDPLQLEKFVVEQEIAKLTALKEGHSTQIRQSRQEIERLQSEGIPAAEKMLEIATTKNRERETESFGSPPFAWTVGGKSVEQKEAAAEIDSKLEKFAAGVKSTLKGQVHKGHAYTNYVKFVGPALTASGQTIEMSVSLKLDDNGIVKEDAEPYWGYRVVPETMLHQFNGIVGMAASLRNRVGSAKAGLQEATDNLSARNRNLLQLKEIIKSDFPRQGELDEQFKRLDEINRQLRSKPAEKKPATEFSEVQYGETIDGQQFFFSPNASNEKTQEQRRAMIVSILDRQEAFGQQVDDNPREPLPPGYHPEWIPRLETELKEIESELMGRAMAAANPEPVDRPSYSIKPSSFGRPPTLDDQTELGAEPPAYSISGPGRPLDADLEEIRREFPSAPPIRVQTDGDEAAVYQPDSREIVLTSSWMPSSRASRRAVVLSALADAGLDIIPPSYWDGWWVQLAGADGAMVERVARGLGADITTADGRRQVMAKLVRDRRAEPRAAGAVRALLRRLKVVEGKRSASRVITSMQRALERQIESFTPATPREFERQSPEQVFADANAAVYEVVRPVVSDLEARVRESYGLESSITPSGVVGSLILTPSASFAQFRARLERLAVDAEAATIGAGSRRSFSIGSEDFLEEVGDAGIAVDQGDIDAHEAYRAEIEARKLVTLRRAWEANWRPTGSLK
jgi:N12 class adenine-specific DNA methylase